MTSWVTRRAVRMAASPRHREPADDPGYLIAKGRAALELDLVQVPVAQWLRRVGAGGDLSRRDRASTLALVSTAALLTAAGTGRRRGAALLAFFPASDLAIALIHRFITVSWASRLQLELARACRRPALVVIDASDRRGRDRGRAPPEVHSLANSDPELRFALLSDWADAASESVPDDPALLARARAAIAALNARHGPASGGGDRFWVLHRRRMWNASEGVWMGWERKRGKLRELNRLLRGATDTSFLPPDPGAAPAPLGHPHA